MLRRNSLPKSEVLTKKYGMSELQTGLLETSFESDFFYEGVEDIWADLERMLRQDVDLVVLNRVPATVAAAALQGKPLIVRDWGLYFDFMIIIILFIIIMN
jgi:hypothetical protein